MKIAIVGSGISGLACAYYLQHQHDVHVFEQNQRIGGHTATVDVSVGGRQYAIDTGFIVYNDWTYPNFIALLDELGVENQPTAMSFSVSDRLSGLEWAGSNLDALFAQRGNLVSPRFLGMVRDILRFNKESVADLEAGQIDGNVTLGEYLRRNRYGKAFIEQYLVPMGSAIWSADTDVMDGFPLQFFVRFFKNHGLLSIKNRPQWRVIKGGSREYLGPLTAGFKDQIHTGNPVTGVSRQPDGVTLTLQDGRSERFDQVVLACHSDQALALLNDPSATEREVLGAMRYQDNDVVLHTDTRLLPDLRKTWSAWNYLLTEESQRAVLTYNMNILQGIDSPETFCVTLNHTHAINPHKILGRFNYAHPVFSLEQVNAQERWAEINTGQTWYCGAYWHNGFHEDGVRSAKRVAEAIIGEATEAPRAMVSAA
ncbi:MAG: FAD-dependent oxidoreductase [Halieaceae bacterium]|nr:FAD-dependent oxidoreductase [Halieaceae bacterium]